MRPCLLSFFVFFAIWPALYTRLASYARPGAPEGYPPIGRVFDFCFLICSCFLLFRSFGSDYGSGDYFTVYLCRLSDRPPVCQCAPFFRVENNGFEPMTPCLQSRCSSQLS